MYSKAFGLSVLNCPQFDLNWLCQFHWVQTCNRLVFVVGMQLIDWYTNAKDCLLLHSPESQSRRLEPLPFPMWSPSWKVKGGGVELWLQEAAKGTIQLFPKLHVTYLHLPGHHHHHPTCPNSMAEVSTACNSAIGIQTDSLMQLQTIQGRWETSSNIVPFGQTAVSSVCTALSLPLQVKSSLPFTATLSQQNKAAFWILHSLYKLRLRLRMDEVTLAGCKCDWMPSQEESNRSSIRGKADKPNIQ